MHPLVKIMEANAAYDEKMVTRWCPVCGVVVVDLDYDGRTKVGYYMKMKKPKMTE